jgi:O-methyltransferase involved in polyketide biosynthesis
MQSVGDCFAQLLRLTQSHRRWIAEKGYITDRFARRFAAVHDGATRRISPFIARGEQPFCRCGCGCVCRCRFLFSCYRVSHRSEGYFARVFAFDQCAAQFCRAQPAETAQIVSLGAGRDAGYFRLLSSIAPAHPRRYVELDLPSVARTKKSMIDSILASGASAAVTPPGVHRIVAADLRDAPAVCAALIADGGLDPA